MLLDRVRERWVMGLGIGAVLGCLGLWGAVTACKSLGQGGDDSMISSSPTIEIEDDFALTPGPVADGRLKQFFYGALEAYLANRQGTGDSSISSGRLEMGDLDTFRMTILRLSHGTVDVSTDPAETVDGMDVEVTGWYKRLPEKDSEGRTKTRCFSFDIPLHAAKKDKTWTLIKDPPMVFSREDEEDCF